MVAAGCGGGSDSAVPAPTTGSAPAASTAGATSTTAPSTAAAGYLWSRATAPALTVGGGATTTLGAVLAPALGPLSTGQGSAAGITGGTPIPGSTWLVAGTTTTAEGRTTATLWTSTDATTWTSTPLTGPGVDSQAHAATRWGDRTVVVGSIGSGSARRAAVWLSAESGGPFVAVAAQATLAAPVGQAGDAEMDVVAAGALGVFAAGTTAGRETMWYSTDGRHWTRLAGADRILAGSADARVRSLLVAPTGVFAAGDLRNGAGTDGAIWTSTDGVGWQPVHATQGVFSGGGDHTVADLVQFGTSFVAVGAVRAGASWSPASWISPDGMSWDQPSESFPLATMADPDPAGTQVAAVSVTDTGLVAVGGSRTNQRVWASSDGTSWSEVALPTNAAGATNWHAGLVATNGDRTVVVDNLAGQPYVLTATASGWVEVSADPSVFGPVRATASPGRLVSTTHGLILVVNVSEPSQALGAEHHSAVVLTSTDGTAWTQTTSGGVFAGRSVSDVATTTTGLIAAGTTDPTPAGDRSAAFWTSADATTWSATPSDAAVLGGSPGVPGSAAAAMQVGSTDIAIGHGPVGATATTGGTAVGWSSIDGVHWSSSGTLDPQPGLGLETPEGLCPVGAGVAAVGTTAGDQPGRHAAAWWTTRTGAWRRGTVAPVPDTGASEAMLGCAQAGGQLTAYGEAAAGDGTLEGALWHSSDGRNWTRRSVSGLAGEAPVTDLATTGATWLATAGQATGTNAASLADGPPAPTSLSTAGPGAIGLWRSTDGGSTWQRLDTSGSVFGAQTDAEANQVVFLAGQPVVAGSVDGQLAVWVGATSADPTG